MASTSPRPTAVVTDARYPAALAGIRALAAAGVAVVAADSHRLAAGCWSRAAVARARVPDPGRHPVAFGERVGELRREHGDAPVFAASEMSIDAILGAGLGQAFAPAAVLAALRAKPDLEALARSAGMRAPRELARTSGAGLAALEIEREVVIKGADPAGALRGMRSARGRDELRAVSAVLPREVELIVQERVTGPQLSVAVVLARDGELLARFQHAVGRMWPLDGGSTSLARSEAPDDDVIAAIADMLRGAGFWGLAQLDLVKSDEGIVVLDINTRFYGSMALASACGINLPAAWYSAVQDVPRPEPRAYRRGLSFWWAEADISTLRRMSRPRGGHVGPLLARGDLRAAALMQGSTLAIRLREKLRRAS